MKRFQRKCYELFCRMRLTMRKKHWNQLTQIFYFYVMCCDVLYSRRVIKFNEFLFRKLGMTQFPHIYLQKFSKVVSTINRCVEWKWRCKRSSETKLHLQFVCKLFYEVVSSFYDFLFHFINLSIFILFYFSIAITFLIFVKYVDSYQWKSIHFKHPICFPINLKTEFMFD